MLQDLLLDETGHAGAGRGDDGSLTPRELPHVSPAAASCHRQLPSQPASGSARIPAATAAEKSGKAASRPRPPEGGRTNAAVWQRPLLAHRERSGHGDAASPASAESSPEELWVNSRALRDGESGSVCVHAYMHVICLILNRARSVDI